MRRMQQVAMRATEGNKPWLTRCYSRPTVYMQRTEIIKGVNDRGSTIRRSHARFFEGSWEHAVAGRKLESSTLEGGVGVEEACRSFILLSFYYTSCDVYVRIVLGGVLVTELLLLHPIHRR